jgi:hypothetical protein
MTLRGAAIYIGRQLGCAGALEGMHSTLIFRCDRLVGGYGGSAMRDPPDGWME